MLRILQFGSLQKLGTGTLHTLEAPGSSSLLSLLLRSPCGGSSNSANTGPSVSLVRGAATIKARKGIVDTSGLKFWAPTTNGQRFRITIKRDDIWKGGPKRGLYHGVNNTGGRNNQGRITMWHRGGGHKTKLRMVDFKRTGQDSGVVERLEYDPGRTAYLALLRHSSSAAAAPSYSYILAPQELKVGTTVVSGTDAPIQPGNTLALHDMPAGIPIHSIEMNRGQGGILCRAAGCTATIMHKTDRYACVRLPSGEQRLIPLNCRATVGSVSNPNNKNRVLAKAGYNRWLGRRPIVRGIAMNPVDHPHGGRANGGRPSCTPWGIPCKGYRTRKRGKHSSKFVVVSRRKAKGKL